MGNNTLILVSGSRTLRFTRFQISDTPINIPEVEGLLKPYFKLYVFDCTHEGQLRLLVENPFVGTPRTEGRRTSLKIMTPNGLTNSVEVLTRELDVEGNIVSISSTAGYLNIPTGHDLPDVNGLEFLGHDRRGSSVSFNLSASDGSNPSVSRDSSRRLHNNGAEYRGSPRGDSPRLTTLPLTSSFVSSQDRCGNLSPKRSPRTPRDYLNLTFWRPTAHPGSPPVYYFGRQGLLSEEISFMNQLVGHLSDEASVRFERYLGP